jgi:hypothetical protein
MMPEVDVVPISDPRDAGRLESLADGEARCQGLVDVATDDHRRLVLRHEPGGELRRRHVEVLERRGALELLRLLGHERRPLLVEVDEVLSDHLTLRRVRGEEGFGTQP